MNKTLCTALAAMTSALLLGGCPTTPVVEEGPVAEPRTPAQVDTAALPGRGLPAGFNDPTSPLYQRVIYFDYDRSDILPQFVEVLRAHAAYLATNSQTRIMLEGHSDERGTREYNLALAEQRAGVVRQFMLAEGVSASQIDTLSYGEERPTDRGHNDSSWALNRRVQLVY